MMEKKKRKLLSPAYLNFVHLGRQWDSDCHREAIIRGWYKIPDKWRFEFFDKLGRKCSKKDDWYTKIEHAGFQPVYFIKHYMPSLCGRFYAKLYSVYFINEQMKNSKAAKEWTLVNVESYKDGNSILFENPYDPPTNQVQSPQYEPKVKVINQRF